MSQNTIKIDVDLKNNLKQAENIFNTAKGNGSFDGPGGKEASIRIEGAIKVLQTLMANEEVAANDFKELGRLMKDVISTLEQFVVKGNHFSEEVLKLKAKLDQKQETLSSKRSERDLLEEQQAKAYSNFNDQANYNFFKRKKDGTISKQQITNPDTIRENAKKGQLVITTTSGKQISDPKKVQQAIDGLFSDYERIGEQIINVSKDIEGLEKKVESISQEVDAALSKEGNQAQAELLQKLSEIKRNTNNALDAGKSTFSKQKQEAINAANAVNTLAQSTQKQSSALGKAFKTLSIYAIALRAVKSALREAVSTIKELDKSLTEQAMVTGLTRQQTYGLIKDYQNLAREVGATTKEVAGVATEYMKQGKTIEDSMVLTKAAVSAAKVARVSVGDSVNYLTTALNGFRLSADQAMKVSDKFAAVAASSATDYDELAIALSKVASQANLAGMSIDYTTALLTKGLETTREAPETMGTALKTVIARMRELSDYGETLQDGIDINNVESQLSYVGIALRGTNGELRSTQDVLDELGRKWETLNTNQQAAVAKALAGTRQQSRLIAMMDGYERVIELQQIAERSEGATMAQASTYLEGIEASLNRVSVAWEKIISTLVNSDFIIGLIDKAAFFLDNMGKTLENVAAQKMLYAGIAFIATGILAKKQLESQIAKDQLKLQREQRIEALKQRQEELIQTILGKQGLEIDDATLKYLKAQLAYQKAINAEKAGTGSADETILAEHAANAAENAKITAEQAKNFDKLKEAMASNSIEGQELSRVTNELNLLQRESNHSMVNGIRTLALLNIWQSVAAVTTKVWTWAVKLHTAAVIKGTAAVVAFWTAATLGIAAIAGGVIAGIIGLVKAFSDTSSKAEKATKKIAKLSTEIYKLNESSQKLNDIVDKFETLDSNVIKTNKDLKETNTLLKSAGESIDFSWNGTRDEETEKSVYYGLSDEGKKDYIKRYRAALKEKTQALRQETINELRNLSPEEREKELKKAENIAAMQANNNAFLFDQLDARGVSQQVASVIQKVGMKMMDNLSGSQAYTWANNKFSKNLADTLVNLGTFEKESGEVVSILEKITSDSYSLSEKIETYTTVLSSLTGENATLFKTAFADLETFAHFSKTALEGIDAIGLSIDDINALGKAIQKMGISVDESSEKIEDFIENLIKMKDIKAAFDATFTGKQDFFNSFLRDYGKIVGTGSLNLAQNLDSFNSTITDFYKKANEWNKMSESDKQDFISKNQSLFDSDPSLLEAFKTGDYSKIETALSSNKELAKRKQTLLKQINTDLALEQEKTGKDRDDTYIKYLLDWKNKLENGTDLFKADLDLLIKQENEQLKIYKDYLKEQQKILNDSLKQRKESYQKYFNAIAADEKEDEYLNESTRLQENIVKLSTNTQSNSQRIDLEYQLEELEKNRVKELRKEAQEKVIENLDDRVNEINEKFDKLLENEAVLLKMFGKDLQDPNFIDRLLSSPSKKNMTSNQFTDWINNISSALRIKIDPAKIDKMKETQNVSNTTINIEGQHGVNLDQSFTEIVAAAVELILQQAGYR